MSSEDPCSDELSAIVAAFNQRGTVEPGLNVEGDALLQLRKACRILDGIRALRDIDRYHTLVVEGSFAALERTVQFYVVERGLAESNELLSHEDTFDYGAQAGIFSRSTKDELIELWKNHRNSTYYQQERATAEQATTMLAYAECMHDHIPKLAGRAHDCVC
ncbi:hypothetical protein [Halobellus ordinarius]|uniref:hypothetical protein n=1 Tax=Halobellus ordinarius TaxID=3075120 RepID=UPI0028801D51|nr:hypothetical protein [Halobellus sp. ZY16]